VRTDRAVRKRLRQIQRLPRGGQRAPRAPRGNRDHQHDSRHRVAPRPPRHCRADRSPHPVTTPGAQAAGRRHLLSRVRGRSSSASKRRRSSLTVKVINVLAVVSASRSAAGVTTRKACSGMARVSRRRRRPHRRQPGPLGHAIDGSSDHLGGQRRFGGELNGVGNGPFGGGSGPHSRLSADTAAGRSSCARLGSRTPNTLPLPNSRSAQRCHCTGVVPQSSGAFLHITGLIDNQDRLGVAQMINDMGPQIGHTPSVSHSARASRCVTECVTEPGWRAGTLGQRPTVLAPEIRDQPHHQLPRVLRRASDRGNRDAIRSTSSSKSAPHRSRSAAAVLGHHGTLRPRLVRKSRSTTQQNLRPARGGWDSSQNVTRQVCAG
jgi:hypothetical protein